MFKGIKTAIAVALSIGGLGTAVTLSAVSASPKEMKAAEATGSFAVRFTNNYNWGSVYAYAWNEGGTKNAAWPGQAMSWIYNNGYGQGIWEITLSEKFEKVIFNANASGNGNQTVDIVVGDNNAWYINGTAQDGKRTVDDGHNFLSTLYLYDVNGTLGSTPKLYAWGNNGKNAEWPGSDMTEVSSPKSSGRIFKYDNFDERFDQCIFNNGSGSQTGDLTTNLHKCYSLSSTSEGDWVTVEEAYSDDFNDNLMLMSSSTTGQCVEAYPIAKECFNSYTQEIKDQIQTDHPDALTRFAAWAKSQGDSFNSTSLTFNSKALAPISNDNKWIIIVITSSVLATSLGAFFLLRKKKKQY